MKRSILKVAGGIIGIGILASAGWVAYAANACNTNTHPAIRGRVDCGSPAEAIQLASIVEVTARANYTTGQTIRVNNSTIDYSVDFTDDDPVLPQCFEAQQVPDAWAVDMRANAIIVLVDLVLMLAVVIALARYYSRPEAWVTPPADQPEETQEVNASEQ